jgi:molecular chaperone DnaK (HSP70)
MPYVLGIDVGSSTTVAAVSRVRGATWTRPEVVGLAPYTTAVSSVVYLSPDGSLTVGDPPVGDPPAGGPGGGRAARGFVPRIGDDVPVLMGGQSCSAEALTATVAMWVVERVTAREGGEHPRSIVLAHPAGWGPYRRELLHRALWDIGLGAVTLLPRTITVAESHAARGFGGATAAVYTLGGTSFEASLVRAAQHGGFEAFGLPQTLEQLGGADFDEALAEHVRTVLGRELTGAAKRAPGAAPSDLRSECARAKRDLTVATETDVVVRLPRGPARVPVTRTEFEEMVRPALQATVDLLDRTVRSAGLTPGGLDGVLLAGGSARIPLITELLAARFPGPIEVQADPQVTAATGAALAGCQVVAQRARRTRRASVASADGSGTRPPAVARTRVPERYRDDPAQYRSDPDRYREGPDRYGEGLDRYRDGPDRYRDGPADPPPRPPVRIAPLDLPKASRLPLVRGRGREG